MMVFRIVKIRRYERGLLFRHGVFERALRPGWHIVPAFPLSAWLERVSVRDALLEHEQLDVIGKAFLGQTIACARCHDHKFDPIPTRDYYALAGILKGVDTLKHANVSGWVERPLPLSEAEKADFKRAFDIANAAPVAAAAE